MRLVAVGVTVFEAYTDYTTRPLPPPFHFFFTKRQILLNWKCFLSTAELQLTYHYESKKSWRTRWWWRIWCQSNKQKRLFGNIWDVNPILIGNLMTLLMETELITSIDVYRELDIASGAGLGSWPVWLPGSSATFGNRVSELETSAGRAANFQFSLLLAWCGSSRLLKSYWIKFQ